MTFIITNIVHHDDTKELENLFKKLDTNQDGKLSELELIEGRIELIQATSKRILIWIKNISRAWSKR